MGDTASKFFMLFDFQLLFFFIFKTPDKTYFLFAVLNLLFLLHLKSTALVLFDVLLIMTLDGCYFAYRTFVTAELHFEVVGLYELHFKFSEF